MNAPAMWVAGTTYASAAKRCFTPWQDSQVQPGRRAPCDRSEASMGKREAIEKYIKLCQPPLYKAGQRVSRDLCLECGVKIEEFGGTKKHMVEAHGYEQVGAQVFKRIYCACGKPGLYRVNATPYCKDHLPDAVARRRRYEEKVMAPKHVGISTSIKREERFVTEHERLHQVKKRGHK